MSIFWRSCRLGAQYMYAINSVHGDPRDENELEDIGHEIKLATAEYVAWNVHWHNSGQVYHDVETLKAVFSQVNILEQVDVNRRLRRRRRRTEDTVRTSIDKPQL
jgi:hypothetical protein